MEIFNKLGIDFKILIAQLVNFFLLLYILQRFLYKPLFALMKKREEKIKLGLENTVKIQEKMEKVEKDIQEKMIKTNQQINAMLTKAKKESDERKGDLLEKAKREIETQKKETRDYIEAEKKKIGEEVLREVSPLIVEIAAKFLTQKVDNQDKQLWIKEINSAIDKKSNLKS